MFKLFKRCDGGIEYHEAWRADDAVIEHWGRCGTRGEVRRHVATEQQQQQRIMELIMEQALNAGFEPIDEEEMDWLLVQSAVDGFGARGDLTRRHELEDYLDDLLGWYGLGHCDGGSIGTDTMEAACLVIDFEIARTAIAPNLAASAFSGFAIMRQER